jgi:hypothetical protein
MSHLSWKKNRDTGGVTCMESYVGNTPPNERFSLWDVCFMCFLGAAAKRYSILLVILYRNIEFTIRKWAGPFLPSWRRFYEEIISPWYRICEMLIHA